MTSDFYLKLERGSPPTVFAMRAVSGVVEESPSTIERRFAAFLDEPMWVCWKQITRTGRRTKLPINAATGRAASATRPQTWTNYEQATLRTPRSGLGIVLTRAMSGFHLVGVDLDSCRDSNTGAIAAWASDVLGMIASYAEVSPSGTGLKIFALVTAESWEEMRDLFGAGTRGAPRLGRSWKEPGSAHPAGVEVYLGARYFAVTGAALNDESVNVVEASDLRRLINFCDARFHKRSNPFRNAAPARTGRGDFSESGRAFHACLAAVRAGIAMQDVPQWASAQTDRHGAAKYDVSGRYWDRARPEGTQLTRDFLRAQAFLAWQKE